MPKIHAFNTRRVYSLDGQRIAWTVLSTGNVAMSDIDRHIDYVLIVGAEPTDESVLAAYDANRTAPWTRAEANEVQALQKDLIAAALAAPSLNGAFRIK